MTTTVAQWQEQKNLRKTQRDIEDLDRIRRELILTADHHRHPNVRWCSYRGWGLARIKDVIISKLGIAFTPGELVLVKRERHYDFSGQYADIVAYSNINRIQTHIGGHLLEHLIDPEPGVA